MAIDDPSSELYTGLQAELPICVDPQELSVKAGRYILDQISTGDTREAAVVHALNELTPLARFAGHDVIALDSGKLFGSHPEIRQAVDDLMTTKDWTRGRAVTQLLLNGARQAKRPQPQPTNKPFSMSDFTEAIKNMGGTENSDGSFRMPPADGAPPTTMRPRIRYCDGQ